MNDDPRPTDSEEMKQFAMFIASVVRNAMEGFHCQHLTDDQMKELNPIIRNAVYTALHAFNHYERSPESRRFTDANMKLIPKYWESPEFLSHYLNIWRKKETDFKKDLLDSKSGGNL